jgi:hypothetical protein
MMHLAALLLLPCWAAKHRNVVWPLRLSVFTCLARVAQQLQRLPKRWGDVTVVSSLAAGDELLGKGIYGMHHACSPYTMASLHCAAMRADPASCSLQACPLTVYSNDIRNACHIIHLACSL